MSFAQYLPGFDCVVAQSHIIEGNDLISMIRPTLGRFNRGPFSLIEKRFNGEAWRLADLVTDPVRREKELGWSFDLMEEILEILNRIHSGECQISVALKLLGLDPRA